MVDPATLLVDVNVRLDAQRDARADADLLASGVLWAAVALTLVSGAQYLLDGRAAATTLGHRTAPVS